MAESPVAGDNILDERPTRHGSALAVDLRRARAIARRAERAGRAAPSPPTPRAQRIIECAGREPIDCVREWFATERWQPFPFQEEVWRAYLAGESGLIHAATGTGKTYAAWLGPVLEWLANYGPSPPRRPAAPLTVLWITPLRALAADTEDALRAPVEDLGLPWTVESRTGDTPPGIRARQSRRLPSALVTTPESLALLLSRTDAATLFQHLELVVVDEWHELMASKRGVQTELGLARLRRWRPTLRTWGLSATLGNLDTARDTLLGVTPDGAAHGGRIIRGLVPKALDVDSLIPETIERFPWS
ncbi:MAG TPA: DEAD/DEAH box helicase, partial [Gemmatimonadales bacterium]|nr:DEAD/DEAH box helicase [Gemmatimonadales bacterium]